MDQQKLRKAAVENDFFEMEQLLQGPQDPNLEAPRTLFGPQTPIFPAASRGHVDAIRLLLETCTDKDWTEISSGATPLLWACSNGHVEVARLLLEARADKDNTNAAGESPIYNPNIL